ncbi:MAG: FxsA family protein [Candidatus Nanopelagicales bacterium]|nr:FxsA family protein [Candidatus Nanopelagicales bacterium]
MLLRRLLLFGYPLVEILLLWWIATLIGWGLALILVIAGIPAGAALMRNAAAKGATLQNAPESAKPGIARSMTSMFLAGLLIMIPGFLTDLLGILLLLPPVQQWTSRRMGNWVQARMVRTPGFTGYARGDVVQGYVVMDNNPQKSDEGPEGPSPEISR